MGKDRRISREDRVLLLLARRTLTHDIREEASRLLDQGLDWPHILRRAAIHHVTPLLYHNLCEFNLKQMPREIYGELENRYRTNVVWSSLSLRELKRVLTRLSEGGIPVVPLKGLPLATALYGDIKLRDAGDIDILVPRDKILQALNLLLSIGYKTNIAYDDAVKLGTPSGEYQLVRLDGQLRYLVELHWSALWGLMVQRGLDDLWTDARLKSIFDHRIYTLSPEWELLYLASHATYHHTWQKLKWLVDIHELCSQVEIDWSKIWEKAKLFGVEYMLQLTLNICHTSFETANLANFNVDRLPPWVTIFPDKRADEELSPGQPLSFDLHAISVQVRLISRPADKARHIFFLLLTPTSAEQGLIHLAPRLEPLYSLIRAVNVGCKLYYLLLDAGFKRLSRGDSDPQPK